MHAVLKYGPTYSQSDAEPFPVVPVKAQCYNSSFDELCTESEHPKIHRASLFCTAMGEWAVA